MISSRVFQAALASCLSCAVALGQSQADLEERARVLLRETPLIDGHNDVPWQYNKRVKNQISKIDLRADLSLLDPPMHTDIPRLRGGGVGGQFWSVYVPVIFKGSQGIRAVIEQIDVARRLIDAYPDVFELALTADDIERIHRGGKVASLLGMEGGHSIGNSLAALRMFHGAGARYMTLTHSENTEWADSCTDEPASDGLSRFGVEVVREMNRLGMMVDISHVHPLTMHDVLDVAEAPVIFSHSSSRGVANHPRNVPDDVASRLAAKDGVIMITFVSGFINATFGEYSGRENEENDRLTVLHPEDPALVKSLLETWRSSNPMPPNATLEEVANHFDHLRALIGTDHIGLGGDYDGTDHLPIGLEDVSKYPALFAELYRRGYTDDDIRKIAGQNLLRVMRKVESVADRLQRERGPSDARIDDYD